MKERPIIFDAESVLAILDGRKTQMRQAIQPQPWIDYRPDGEPGPLMWAGWNARYGGTPDDLAQFCPSGGPGQRLWVQEVLGAHDGPHGGLIAAYYAGGKPLVVRRAGQLVDWWKASTDLVRPLLMPRWASRITLEITSVRVELDASAWMWIVDFERVTND